MSNTESNLNPVEPEPTEIFFKKDPVSALSNVEPVVEGEQGDSDSPELHIKPEQVKSLGKVMSKRKIAKIIEEMEANIAKHDTHERKQIGGCVYCMSCNERLYQGKL